MIKNKSDKPGDQKGGITDKQDMNAGSAAFNQGSEQDPDYNKGTKVSDEEKKSSHKPPVAKKKKTPGKENRLQNNAGRYE